MMGIQPYFKPTLPTVLKDLCKVGHDIFITNPKTKSILKYEGIEHSMDERRILCLTGNLLCTQPVEPRA